eukprot:TRINITY_DN81634_c0_g1_i1.p1 TRINITY_DN81634_c0_g1~~TRINITY_DN81634_c0_g1_i1.p1  ORF type:complete len:359 (-),score=74.74 TRINITY_DN81634_c0_g1_i1:402-1478(-)
MAFRPIASGISCMAWNADRTMVALSPNDNKVLIYKVTGMNTQEWDLLHTLEAHEQAVTGIDWAPKTNRIVSCAQDRNAFVWSYVDGAWKPNLVMLKSNRAALCVQWSPSEKKFAVGTGSKTVSICFYEDENDWWVSKEIKSAKSSVLSVSWHPNSLLIAFASSDRKCSIAAAKIKETDQELPGYREVGKFGEVFQSVKCGGWVHDCCFSPSGRYLAFVAHDSCVYVKDLVEEDAPPCVVTTKMLPFTSCIFVAEDTIACAGHDYIPMTYVQKGGVWEEGSRLDGNADESEDAAVGRTSSVSEARKKFMQQAQVGSEKKKKLGLKTKHRNTILELRLYDPSDKAFCSAGLDGRICFWKA